MSDVLFVAKIGRDELWEIAHHLTTHLHST